MFQKTAFMGAMEASTRGGSEEIAAITAEPIQEFICACAMDFRLIKGKECILF
jgi:hypothetical protein